MCLSKFSLLIINPTLKSILVITLMNVIEIDSFENLVFFNEGEGVIHNPCFIEIEGGIMDFENN